MNKIFTLEAKGEVIGIVKHNNLGYMDFLRICKEIEETTGSKDLYTVKASLIENYGFEDVILQGGYEVTKRKGVL